MTKGGQFLFTVSVSKGRVSAQRSRQVNRVAKPSQLSLALPSSYSVFFIDVSCFSHIDIISSLTSTKPKWVFDVRTHPRLDVIAGTRATAFRYFKRYHSTYVDVFGRFCDNDSATTNPARLSAVLREMLQGSDRRAGPYLFFMDDSKVIESSVRSIPKILEDLVGHKLDTSVISSENGKRR